MKQHPIFVWNEPGNRVYVKAPGGTNTVHEMRIIPPPDYREGSMVNLIWGWMAEGEGEVRWTVDVGELSVAPPAYPEEVDRIMESITFMTPATIKSVSLQEEAKEGTNYLGAVKNMRFLPKDKFWYFRLCRKGAEDAGHNVRITPIFLEYADE